MNRSIMKQFALFFTFLLVFVNVSFMQLDHSSAENLEQAVTITAHNHDGEALIPTAAVPFDDGDTAWDVLDEVADELTYEESDYGKMLNGINGIEPDFSEDQMFWAFIVNGEAASVASDFYDVNHGDNIHFLVTDDIDTLTEVNVSATDNEGNTILKEMTVQVQPSASAYDAIVQATMKENVSLDVTVHSEFFTFIDNIGDEQLTANDWWELSVNDAALEVGALSHQVQPGEHIQLTLQTFTSGDENEDEDSSSDEAKDEVTPDEDKDGDSTTEDESEPSTEVTKKALQEMDFLANYVLDHKLATTYGDEWWAWGLAKSGNKVPASYEKSVQETVIENKGEFGSVFDLEKVIIALSASGIDVTDIDGINLIDKLSTHQGLENPIINAAVYALLAANSGTYEMDSEKENELIELILSSEIDGGGWAFTGNTPSVDITGMVLAALANYKNQSDVKSAIDRAVAFLGNEQAENGGFYEEINGGYTSEAVSQAIIGLVAVGIDPTKSQFTKNGKNLIEHLFDYKTSEGLYSHILDTDQSDLFSATPQAFLALAHYIDFVQPGEKEPIKPQPDDENKGEETPSPNGDNDDKTEDTTKDEIVSPTEEQSGDVNETTVEKNGDKLPETSTNIFNLLGIGLLVVVSGFVFLVLQRKWKTDETNELE